MLRFCVFVMLALFCASPVHTQTPHLTAAQVTAEARRVCLALGGAASGPVSVVFPARGDGRTRPALQPHQWDVTFGSGERVRISDGSGRILTFERENDAQRETSSEQEARTLGAAALRVTGRAAQVGSAAIKHELGGWTLSWQRESHGLPCAGDVVTAQILGKRVQNVNVRWLLQPPALRPSLLTADQALFVALEHAMTQTNNVEGGFLDYVGPDFPAPQASTDGKTRPAWVFVFAAPGRHQSVLIDAETGKFLRQNTFITRSAARR